MITQNYATVPYLLLLFYQERIHDFQSPVLLNMKCIAHVMSKQDQWTFIYVVILFFATLLKFLLNFPRVRHATLL